jgi:hypothetical protein
MANATNITNATNSGTIHLLSHLIIFAACLLRVIPKCAQRVASYPTSYYLNGNTANHKVLRT